MKNTDEDELFYGTRGDYLVFIRKSEALELATLWQALRTSQTWGELRSRIGEDRYEEIINPYFENFYDDLDLEVELTREEARQKFDSLTKQKELQIGHRAPGADDVFDIEMVHGIADGDWPEWPLQTMLNWVPSEIRREFGQLAVTHLNGDFLEFHVSREAEIVAAFEAAGYRCERNQLIIDLASGS